ncbi:MAG TPA: tetratricopeptide repeat protein [Promineifilum sp.]|nr:tetratricopeptide repeat protein [Promineifilum sp.]HQF70334.1 tetratricopeptide repeat protein [Promineifilum sp.]
MADFPTSGDSPDTDSDTLLATIEAARRLRHDDDLEGSQALLLGLMEEFPDDPLVLFEVGGAYDVMGEVEMAIPYYQRAIDAGLEGSDRHECLLCLGSSLRLAGETDDAVETLSQAIDEFPERNSGRVFLALAHYSNGDANEAVRDLLAVLLATTQDADILAYADTFDYVKDNLDETLDG